MSQACERVTSVIAIASIGAALEAHDTSHSFRDASRHGSLKSGFVVEMVQSEG